MHPENKPAESKRVKRKPALIGLDFGAPLIYSGGPSESFFVTATHSREKGSVFCFAVPTWVQEKVLSAPEKCVVRKMQKEAAFVHVDFLPSIFAKFSGAAKKAYITRQEERAGIGGDVYCYILREDDFPVVAAPKKVTKGVYGRKA
jgi:hypothetical protein